MSSKTKELVYCAVLIGIAVAVSYLSIQFGWFRLSLTPVVVMFAGAALGSAAGGVTGAVTDIVAFLIKPTGLYFPGFLLTMALYGALAGVFFHNRETRALSGPHIIGKVVIIQTVCSALLNTLWLTVMTGANFFAQLATRLPATYLSCAVYAALLYLLIRNRQKIVRETAG
jgi:ECF transporter S component (folate family)